MVSQKFGTTHKELIENNDTIYLLEGQLIVKKN